jgi:iron(III) transport system ATP-binding protein
MIRVKKLCKYYRDAVGVKDISFEVQNPGATVIFGPSGSGKTTLLRLIAGLDLPDDGEIYLDNHLVSKKGAAIPAHQRMMGFVFQSPALWPHMTVSANILFGLHALERKEAQQRLKQVLIETGLEAFANRYPDQISAGQARRVALARSIAPKPKFLLMDEPLTNIDAESKEELISLIKIISNDAQTFLLYVSHDASEVKQISERIIRIESGFLKL